MSSDMFDHHHYYYADLTYLARDGVSFRSTVRKEWESFDTMTCISKI